VEVFEGAYACQPGGFCRMRNADLRLAVSLSHLSMVVFVFVLVLSLENSPCVFNFLLVSFFFSTFILSLAG